MLADTGGKGLKPEVLPLIMTYIRGDSALKDLPIRSVGLISLIVEVYENGWKSVTSNGKKAQNS